MRAYFSDIRKEIILRLKSAQKEVKIAMAWFTSAELFNELIECCRRGVSVNLLLLDDAINWMYYAPDFNVLKDAGANIRIVSRDYGMLHHKFCVIDRQLIITGSYNWTYYAETRNIENVVIIDDALLATSYLGEFDAILAKTSVSTNFKRLSWEDIDYESNLNIYELNQEIATIARERQLPEKQIVVTPAKVEIVEKKRTPLSAVNIGIQTSSENSNDCMDIIIKKHTKLPVLNAEQIYYGNVTECNDILLKMYVGDSIYATNNHEILSQGLKNIIPTQKCVNLQIKVSASLNTVGQLHVVVECLETHKSINLMMTNPSFVYYAD